MWSECIDISFFVISLTFKEKKTVILNSLKLTKAILVKNYQQKLNIALE